MAAALFFLLETVFFLLVGAALLRAWMNHLRINMSGQPGRFAMALTHWLVGPVRKILPRSMAQSRVDWGSLLAAVLLAIAYGGLRLLLGAALAPSLGGVMAPVIAIPGLAFYLLVRVLLQGLIFLLLVYAVLSWVQPGASVMGTLDRLCSPLLRPIRRVVPRVGGVDLSVLVLIVLLQVGLILLG
ncbi:YggT family protein [Hydrogenophaga pseudoflava]|uniref:YggT family protein n=1 Tax=Hydrogenophaga pseudoflava TaxID=47421 RepID=UPI0027E5021A|nr:YggT family protein [Hydrogenophaga pseudoflava]MDQ7746550.1 YggT family protein [Hydrogenophaga pseudoflava]